MGEVWRGLFCFACFYKHPKAQDTKKAKLQEAESNQKVTLHQKRESETIEWEKIFNTCIF